jgi:hypothetical protein
MELPHKSRVLMMKGAVAPLREGCFAESNMGKLMIGMVLAALAIGGYALGQATSSALAPATASAPATRPITRTMEFQFENTALDTVLDEMSARLGFVIQKAVPVKGKITVRAPAPVDADEAIVLLNSLLVPLGYAALEKPPQEMEGGGTARVLKVMTWDQAKKEAPVGK